ncbi:leukemia inhibitory factor receptor [Austrofundulus limnaeus]|uniref:Leukemia inhibitory factor receptor n=1 Tax=Austrofundulus limnaeus TaxID=52670 RepID=A0A2I4AIS1_AUSLI|nr:PREDICTED: leukemia inhibitory factor receptor-like [Austrofundulus limnaeus]
METAGSSRMMISCLVLLVLLGQSSQDRSDVLDCEAQNLKLKGSGRTLWVTWDDDPSCSAPTELLTYELMVFREGEQVHQTEQPGTSDRVGSSHSWKWTSFLPLECASHFVRLRSRLNNRLGSWQQSSILPGRNSSKYNEIFPQDEIYSVGSVATFCCILPDGETFEEMYLSPELGSNQTTRRLSSQRYALTLQLDAAWDRCVDVKCTTRGPDVYGGCVYIGYPPDDRDLQCETQDLESVQCFWNTGRDTSLKLKSPTVYQLNRSLCEHGSKGRCSLKSKVDSGERTWTLTAENILGKVELSDTADLMKRVHMLAPEGVKAQLIGARNISLSWSWTRQQYNNLNLTCEVKVQHRDRNITIKHSGIGLNAAVVTDLIPNWKYHVKVRCSPAKDFWKWGAWSEGATIKTQGDVPEALEVWMQRKENRTVILWKKLLDTQSHGHITGYEVNWDKIHQNHSKPTSIPLHVYSHTLTLDTTQQHIVTVTARNDHGRSPPSTIVIPAMGSDLDNVGTSSLSGTNGVLDLSWSRSPAGTCGYVVDWSPVVQVGPVQWLKLPPNQTSVQIPAETLRDGLRYWVQIWACTEGAPLLLQRTEAYSRQTQIQNQLFRSLKFTQQDSDGLVSWDPVPLREQSAFIRGYVLHYQDHRNKVSNVSTEDQEASSLTVKNLDMGSYSFTMVAATDVGEGGNTTITATVTPPTDGLIWMIFISLGAVFLLLFLTTFLCYRHWACIKQKVYPPIPKPVVSDRWISSVSKNGNPYLHPEQCQQNEDEMDVPQLQFKSGARLSGYINEEDMSPLSLSQTPNGYFNTPKPTDVPTSKSWSPAGVQSSPFRALFPNPSYNLTIEGGDQLVSSGPGVLSGLDSSCGYKPQGSVETFSLIQDQQDFGIICNQGYILAPNTS